MKYRILLLAACGVILLGCKKSASPKAGEFKQVPLSSQQKSLIGRSNAFGFDFYRSAVSFAGAGTNLMVSPLSVSMALGMTRNGAAGSTVDSMTRALGFEGMTETEINVSFRYILNTFASLDPEVQVSMANSIWYRNTFSVEPVFIATNRDYFSTSVTPLNFSDPGSVTTINYWVSENTNKLIPKIVDEIPSDMVMYLINAVYFKGRWRLPFDETKTSPRSFYLDNGTSLQAPAMTLQGDLSYYAGDGFEAVGLPYNQGNYNMTVLLPAKGSSPAVISGQLTKENWDKWNANMASADVVLQLPKFRYEYDEKAMIPILSGMGMGVAFDKQLADFTRINRHGGLFISEVKHKTFIETNEEGTEAAAVTSVGIAVTSAGPGSTVYFTVDRPFVYVITEKSTGTIFFIGTVMDPTAH